MEPRIITSVGAFAHPFLIPGHEAKLAEGLHEFLVEEELLQDVSFEAYHPTVSWLMVGNPRHPQAPFEMWDVSPRDLDAALDRDRGHHRSRWRRAEHAQSFGRGP